MPSFLQSARLNVNFSNFLPPRALFVLVLRVTPCVGVFSQQLCFFFSALLFFFLSVFIIFFFYLREKSLVSARVVDIYDSDVFPPPLNSCATKPFFVDLCPDPSSLIIEFFTFFCFPVFVVSWVSQWSSCYPRHYFAVIFDQ